MENEQATRDAVIASVEAAYQGVSAKRKRDEESLEEQKREFAEEVEKVRGDAAEAAVKVKEDAEAEAAEIRRKAAAERAALDAEKAAMEKTYAFQTSIIKLDVGGHKFTTSLPTLTSVPDTYLAALFSGRHPLASNADGAFFVDRCGAHFEHILNFLRDPGRDDNIVTARHATDSPRHSPADRVSLKRARPVSVCKEAPAFYLGPSRMSPNSTSKGLTARWMTWRTTYSRSSTPSASS